MIGSRIGRLYPPYEARRLAELLGKFGSATAAISIYKRDNFGRLGNCPEQQQLLPDQTAIAKELEYARERLKEDRVVPVISVALDLWAWDAMPRRAEAEKAVTDAIIRLEPIREYFGQMADKSR